VVAPPIARPEARVLTAVVTGAVLVAAVVLRFVTRSDLWLDEALSANIAALPLDEIPDALRHDGFPPLFYWLLHLWTSVFGDGDVAARSLSGVVSVATLPVAWFAGRRLGGPRAAWAATLVLASSPFAVRYATEARMYALLSLLALLGYLAGARALEGPSGGRLVAVAAVTAALVLGIAVGTATSSAFQPRYTAVVLPLVAVLAGVGLARIPDARLAAGALVVVVVLGLVGGVREARLERTQGGEVAGAIEAEAAAGDVVAYCPDQLGPATSRHLAPDVRQEPFPLRGDPRFVDWVDYEDRNEDADPEAFAADVLREADEAGGRIWYVWAYGYRTYGASCESLVELLRSSGRVGTTVVARRTHVDEDAELIRYDP